MRISRAPGAALRPFIKTLWAFDAHSSPRADRERVLPTGAMHVVFRISGPPLRLFEDATGNVARTIGWSSVGGARSTFYVRDVSLPVHSVGAQLHPGAAPLLFGIPGEALAGRHTPLEDLWGRAASEARARIAEAGSLERELTVFESILASRLPKVRAMHPAVAEALERFSRDEEVGDVVERIGYSHRRFIELFRQAVGLSPKLFTRITRFQRALARIATGPRASWAEVAIDAGYSDQSHFNRDFVEFAGIPPGRYGEIAPASSNHVPFVTPSRERRG